MKQTAGTLIYDDNCPLCCWYSSLFVRCGLLKKEERKPFSSLDDKMIEHIGLNKSRNEIPLIKHDSGKVLYGIDALLEILGLRFPWIKKAGNIPIINWFLRKLYRLVSYNRKVVVAKKCEVDCVPDFNFRYRMIFLLIGVVFNTLMLFPLYQLILLNLPSFKMEVADFQLAHLGLVGMNCILSFQLPKRKRIEYIGQVNMLAMICILLFVPLMMLTLIWSVPAWIIIPYISMVSVFIFKEYLRRMEYAAILPSHNWIAAFNLAGMMGFVLFLFIK